MGKVIGTRKIARSIRTIVKAACVKTGKKAVVGYWNRKNKIVAGKFIKPHGLAGG